MSVVRVEVEVAPPYAVHVGDGALEAARAPFAQERPRVLISDERVLRLHGSALDPNGVALRLAVPEGEGAKTLGQLERVLEFLAEQRLDRKACLWTLGGGSVLDLGGFAAALYMRGIDVVHCPTTL
ncbi:MAG TPA: 3-dehydroquinate synthase, partial [Planctomycetota bacterium]|nr:3-dehydroquinate synthase [Planctomycetota bacterium]